MEVLSLHREMAGEEGERCRVRYALLEERCGRERCYGLLCCVEGRHLRGDQLRRLPCVTGSRRAGELLLEFLAEEGVTPTHLEEVLAELTGLGLIQMVGAGFCPLGELVQGDGYGRRPPGRSPGRAPLRGASPLRSSGGACGRPPAPCTGCKKGKRPLRHRHAARPVPARPPGFVLRGGDGLLPFGRVGAGG